VIQEMSSYFDELFVDDSELFGPEGFEAYMMSYRDEFFPTVNLEDWDGLKVDLRQFSDYTALFILKRLAEGRPTAVTEDFVFIQNFAVPNVFGWPLLDGPVLPSIPCKEYPLSWLSHSVTRPRVVAWRQKLDGVPYVARGDVLVGDETLVLPPALKFVQYAERIRDTVHILYPYVKVDMEHNGIHYVSHEWRRDKVSVGGEGAIVLMTDGCEYRLKFVPTTEIEFDGHIYEVASAPDCFRPVRPRYGKKPKSEAEALSYLASTVSLMMVDLVVEADFCDIPPDSSQVNVVGDGDCVTVSFRNDAPQGKFLIWLESKRPRKL